MLGRSWHLLRARLAMARRGGVPVPAFVFLAVLGTALAALVRDLLPPFGYALLCLTTGGLLLALPLLSDLGALLRHDEAAEWVGSLPARASERTLARLCHLLILLGALTLAWGIPWALLGPTGFGPMARLSLPLAGLGLALSLATVLIWAQQIFLARFLGAFVLLETATVVLVVVGLLQVLGNLPALASLAPESPGMDWFPPAWFTRPATGHGGTWAALGIALASLLALAKVPPAAALPPSRVDLLGRILEPVSRLALRLWVRPAERGPFLLVYTALPREREVALRIYPMLGIPLAFLGLQARGSHAAGEPWREDALALLLFSVGIYLPLLLTHVPLTESPAASWILRTAPIPERAWTGGAIKALFVRWILPLDLALLGLGLLLSEYGLVARLWLPATLLSLLLLRQLYPSCVQDPPLSVAPEELRSGVEWAGRVLPLAFGLPLLAVVAQRTLTVSGGLLAGLALLLGEVLLERRHRSPPP